MVIFEGKRTRIQYAFLEDGVSMVNKYLIEVGIAINKALKNGVGTYELIGYLELIKVGMMVEWLGNEAKGIAKEEHNGKRRKK